MILLLQLIAAQTKRQDIFVTIVVPTDYLRTQYLQNVLLQLFHAKVMKNLNEGNVLHAIRRLMYLPRLERVVHQSYKSLVVEWVIIRISLLEEDHNTY